MFAFIKSFFESKLSSILADFHQVIADLEAHATQEIAKVKALEVKISGLVEKQTAAQTSAGQATAVAAKLTSLVS